MKQGLQTWWKWAPQTLLGGLKGHYNFLWVYFLDLIPSKQRKWGTTMMFCITFPLQWFIYHLHDLYTIVITHQLPVTIRFQIISSTWYRPTNLSPSLWNMFEYHKHLVPYFRLRVWQNRMPSGNSVLEIQVYLSQVLHLFKTSFIDGSPSIFLSLLTSERDKMGDQCLKLVTWCMWRSKEMKDL